MTDMTCIFCKIASGQIPADILHSDEVVVAFRDVAPIAPTHILIIPRTHVANVDELSAQEPTTLAHIFQVAATLAKSEGLTGYRSIFNTGESAGQSVFHAHLHLLGGRPLAWPPG